MPLVILREQLGNQLFQWASGFALSQRHQSVLRIFTANYGRTGRFLTLRNFPVTARFLSPLPGLFCRKVFGTEIYEYRRFAMIFGEVRALDEQVIEGSVFRPCFRDLPENTLMNGMFQSCLYFLDCRVSIQAELGLLTAGMQSRCRDECSMTLSPVSPFQFTSGVAIILSREIEKCFTSATWNTTAKPCTGCEHTLSDLVSLCFRTTFPGRWRTLRRRMSCLLRQQLPKRRMSLTSC